jgi:excisionase family DNA binding protein
LVATGGTSDARGCPDKRDADTKPETVDAPEVLTVDEAAEFLRMGRNSLYGAIGRGEVPHQRIGKTIRLSRAALMRWLAGSCEVAAAKGHR